MTSTTKSPDNRAGSLPAHVEKILKGFIEAVKEAFADRLSSIVLFGTAAEGRMRATSDVNLVLVLNEFQQKDVTDLAPTVRLARATIRLEVMFLLHNEIPDAMELFAQKFGDIVRRHRVLHGPDPFQDHYPSRQSEIYRLRQVTLNLLLLMRQGYAERAGQGDQIATLLADMAGPLRTCAATVLRLENQGTLAPKEALERFVDSLGSKESVEAIHVVSELRERRATEGADLAKTYFLILDIGEQIRSRAWSLQ